MAIQSDQNRHPGAVGQLPLLGAAIVALVNFRVELRQVTRIRTGGPSGVVE
jgi:hypothetical protein